MDNIAAYLGIMLVCRFSGIDTTFIPSSDCDLELPDTGCTCQMMPEVTITCNGLSFPTWPNIIELNIESIHTLIMSKNNIDHVPEDAFGNISIKHLDFSHNILASGINNYVFMNDQQFSLLSLDLSYNNLETCPLSVKFLYTVQYINFKGNPFTESLNAVRFPNMQYFHLGQVIYLDSLIYHMDGLDLLELSPHPRYDVDLLYMFDAYDRRRLARLKTLILFNGYFGASETFWSLFEQLVNLEISDCNLNDNDLEVGLADAGHVFLSLIFKNNSLTCVPIGFLSPLRVVEYIDLSGNRIEQIRNADFYDTPMLRYISLADNYIQSIDGQPFRHLNELEEMNLRNNELVQIDQQMFPNQFFIGMIIQLAGNPWVCGCDIWWLIQLSHDQHQREPGPLPVDEVNRELKCHEPQNNNDVQLMYSVFGSLTAVCD